MGYGTEQRVVDGGGVELDAGALEVARRRPGVRRAPRDLARPEVVRRDAAVLGRALQRHRAALEAIHLSVQCGHVVGHSRLLGRLGGDSHTSRRAAAPVNPCR